jgi:hypothetical protein
MPYVALVERLAVKGAEKWEAIPDPELLTAEQPFVDHQRCSEIETDDAALSALSALDRDGEFLEVNVFRQQRDCLSEP